jgi:dienelactone hydrolase
VVGAGGIEDVRRECPGDGQVRRLPVEQRQESLHVEPELRLDELFRPRRQPLRPGELLSAERRVALVGASLGGAAVIVAATALRPPPEAVVGVSAPARSTLQRRPLHYSIDPNAAARSLRVPVLLVASSIDTPFPQDARTLYAVVAGAARRLVIVPGPGHGTDLLHGRRDRPALRRRVVSFVRESAR